MSRIKSKTVSDNTIQAEGLGSFFRNLGRNFAEAAKVYQLKYQKF